MSHNLCANDELCAPFLGSLMTHYLNSRWLAETLPRIFVLAFDWMPVFAPKVAHNWSLTVLDT